MTTNNAWTQRILPHTDITVGPCAWRLPMLIGEHADVVKAHPSLIIVDPADNDALLGQAAPHIKQYPVLLGIAEPPFARQLQGEFNRRMTRLDLQRIDALVLHIDDPAEIKSGGMLQTMFDLRDRGVVGTLGLAHPDPRVAEWLAMNTAVRLLGVNYALTDQAIRHRALGQIEAYGMSAYALASPAAGDIESLRFALSQTHRVLPVLDHPIPAELTPMPDDRAEQAWQLYKDSTPPPEPLKRSLPPESH